MPTTISAIGSYADQLYSQPFWQIPLPTQPYVATTVSTSAGDFNDPTPNFTVKFVSSEAKTDERNGLIEWLSGDTDEE